MDGAGSFISENGLDIQVRIPYVYDQSSSLAPVQQLLPTPPPAAPQPVNPTQPTPEPYKTATTNPTQPQPISTLYGYPLKPGSDPTSKIKPEPSTKREPLSVLPDYIKKSVFGFCTDNDCIICPLKTVGKAGKCYACFQAKNSFKNLLRQNIGNLEIIFVLQLKKIYKYIYRR